MAQTLDLGEARKVDARNKIRKAGCTSADMCIHQPGSHHVGLHLSSAQHCCWLSVEWGAGLGCCLFGVSGARRGAFAGRCTALQGPCEQGRCLKVLLEISKGAANTCL
eukprot:1154228-Pelagomonas_calceolata.AAC.5